MTKPLYSHQKNIIAENKLKCGLFLGTGASKTRTALELAEGKTLIICPKQQKMDKTWERENKKWETNKKIDVVSKEWIRTHWEELQAYQTVIIDECHCCLGVLPMCVQRKGIQIPKTSQIFEAVCRLLKKNPPKRLYLLSATPAPKPMAVWAIGKLLGQPWDFFKFREKYYLEVRMGVRRIWLPRKSEFLKQELAKVIQKLGYTGGLNDFFDVPDQTHKVVNIELSPEQRTAIKDLMFSEADPMVRRARMRTIENGVLYGKKVINIDSQTDTMTSETTVYKSYKIDYIVERAAEFPKLLVFANYTAQIIEIEKALRQEGYHNISTLTGATKDRTFIKRVDESPLPHIIIAQSSISSGYELPSFPCVIYASKSWRYVDYEQSLGRVLRANRLKKNLYIHLVANGVDKDCHDTIMSGQDFQDKLTLNI